MPKFDKPFLECRFYFPLTEEHGGDYAESLEFQRVLRDFLRLRHGRGKVNNGLKNKKTSS